MTAFGYHVSHEQFSPSELLDLVQRAEAAGFDCAKCSDHFHPWSERQGQSGFAWSWIGAALQVTRFPIGMITAPGYRYHPAVVAQGAATLGQMFPGRFWLALGSGEAINEAITGLAWPEKPERNRHLAECADVIGRLMTGEEVTHRGRTTTIEARIYSLPDTSVPLIGAAVSEQTAANIATWAEGLLTLGGPPKNVARAIAAYRDAGGRGPIHVQQGLSWASTQVEAVSLAIDQWGPVIVGGEVGWDLRRPSDFDHVARFVTAENVCEALAVSCDLSWHRDRLAELAELADTVHLHCVGRNQRAFIDTFGAKVLSELR